MPLSGLGWPPTQGPLPQPPGAGETARMHHYVTQQQASLLLKLRHFYIAFKLASLCFPVLRGEGVSLKPVGNVLCVTVQMFRIFF